MANIKIGRQIFDVSEKDSILDNGSCYQLVTQRIFKGWHDYPPVISKTLFNKLKKNQFIYTNKELEYQACRDYNYGGVKILKIF